MSYLKKRINKILRKILLSYYQWKTYNGITSLFNKKRFESICIENLEIVARTLEANKVKHWITDGTLLGFYRDGGLIKGDKDIDIGIMIEDLPSNIHYLLKKEGLSLLRENGTKENGLEYTYTRKGANLDIFFFYYEKDYVWHANWLGSERIRFKYPIFELKKEKFGSREFWTPKNIEEYLELKYGKNWRIPIGKWDWAKDPENIF
jgi:phosphorylcholine metabolism protein LicD